MRQVYHVDSQLVGSFKIHASLWSGEGSGVRYRVGQNYNVRFEFGDDMWDLDVKKASVSDRDPILPKPIPQFGEYLDCAESAVIGFKLYYSTDHTLLSLLAKKLGCWDQAESIMNVIRPRFSDKFDGKISLYKNIKDARRERLTAMKLGRAFKFMMPDATDVQIEECVDAVRKQFDKRDFKLLVGNSRDTFNFAYTAERVSYRNPRTTSQRKSIASSCMHDITILNHDSHSDISPAEVYASGDFKVAYLIDNRNRIGGRVVYRVFPDGSISSGPIYGACEHSLDLLEEHINSHTESHCDWGGAKLLRLDDGYGRLIGPYLDGYDEVSYYDDKYLVVGCGEYDAGGTDGYFDDIGTFCGCCEDTFNSEFGGAYIEAEGQDVCEHCLESYYVYSETYGEYISSNNAVEVICGTNRYGLEYDWMDENDDHVYCEWEEVHYRDHLVIYNEEFDLYIPKHLVDDSSYDEVFKRGEFAEEKEAA